MRMDRRAKAARIPAKLKKNNDNRHSASKSKEQPQERKHRPSRSRTKSAKESIPDNETVLRQDRQELIESQQRLLATFERAPVGIVECSLDGRYINVNQEFCRISGYEKDELLSRGIKDLTHEEDYSMDIILHQRLVEDKIPSYQIEKRYVRKDGGIVWAELTRNVVRDSGGKTLYTIGVVLDVTERKRVELEVRNLSRLPSENPNPVMRLTPDGKILYANAASVLLLESWKRQDDQTIPEELQKHLAEAFVSGSKKEIEIEHNGKTFICTLAPIREAGYVNFYGNEITKRKQVEEALQLARQQAERTSGRMVRLQKVTAALSESLTPLQVAEVVVEQGAPTLGAVSATVTLLAEDGQTLEMVYSTVRDSIARPYQRFSLSMSVPSADAVRSGQLVWIESRQQFLERYPHLAEQITAWGQQAAVAIPMVDKGRTLGVLSLSFDRSLAYTPEDESYMLTLARQGAQALERARLYETERQARQVVTEFARQQEALYRLVNQMHRTDLLEDVFNAALDAILSALQCDRASILLVDDKDVMRFVAWRGLSDNYRKATDGHSPWKPGEKNPEPICIHDIDTADLSDSLIAIIKGEGIGSLAFIPLVSNGRLIGKFMTYYNAAHVFTEEEVQLSLTIARQFAFGIDRKQAEEKLRESEKRFRNLANAMPSIVWTAAPDGTILYANEKWYDYTGISIEENAKNWAELVLHPEDYERGVREWTQALETTPDEYHIEIRHRRHDGEYRWFQTRAVPVRDASGKVTAWYGVTTDIHDRVESEKALRASEEEKRHLNNELQAQLDEINSLLAILPTGVWVGNHDCSVITGNPAAYQMLELPPGINVSITSPESQMPTALRIFVNDEEVSPHEAPLQQVARTGKPLYNLEHDLLFADGRRKSIQANIVPLFDQHGAVRKVIASYTDITERKKVEEALRASEALYRAIARSIPGGGIFVVDRDLRYIVAEGVVTEAFGLTREMLEGHVPSEVFNKETSAKMEERFRRTFAGETVSYETKHNGHIYWTQQALMDNPLGHVIVVTIDVTERKQIEEALRESEERFSAILSQATAGIVRKDTEGRFVYVNQAFCNMLGYTEADLLGKTVWEFMHEDDVAENKQSFDRLMIRGIPFKLERRFIRGDGSVIWVDASVSPITDVSGRPQSAVAVEVDITGRKQAEETLQQLNLQLETRVQSRTEKLNDAIRALREEINERKQVEDALYESRKRLQILSQRLVEVQEEERRAIARELHDRVGQSLSALNINLIIVRDQLSPDAVARVGPRLDDSMHLVGETITLVRDVMTDLRPAVLDDYGLEAALQSYIDEYRSRYQIKVRFDHPDQDIPRLGPSLEMTLLRIAQEALTNAARHAQTDQVSVALQLEDGAVHLMVKDHGVGLEAWQERKHADSHGLKIMRERAEAFGGTVHVESAPGKGTKVEATIPIQNGGQNNIRDDRR